MEISSDHDMQISASSDPINREGSEVDLQSVREDLVRQSKETWTGVDHVSWV